MENTVVELHHKAKEEAARPAATRRPWWLYAVGLAVLSGAGWYFWYRIRNKSERERITENALVELQRQMHLRWLDDLRNDAATAVLKTDQFKDVVLDDSFGSHSGSSNEDSELARMQQINAVNLRCTDNSTALMEQEFHARLLTTIPVLGLQKAIVVVSTIDQKVQLLKLLTNLETGRQKSGPTEPQVRQQEERDGYATVQNTFTPAQLTALAERAKKSEAQLYRDLQRGGLHESEHIQMCIVQQGTTEAIQLIGTEREKHMLEKVMEESKTAGPRGDAERLAAIDAFVDAITEARGTEEREELLETLERTTLRVQNEFSARYKFYV